MNQVVNAAEHFVVIEKTLPGTAKFITTERLHERIAHICGVRSC